MPFETRLPHKVAGPALGKLVRAQLVLTDLTNIAQEMGCQFPTLIASTRLEFEADLREFVAVSLDVGDVGKRQVFLQQDRLVLRLVPVRLEPLEQFPLGGFDPGSQDRDGLARVTATVFPREHKIVGRTTVCDDTVLAVQDASAGRRQRDVANPVPLR